MSTVESRFLDKVEVTSDGSCWEWTACKNDDGYGWFRLGGRPRLAHTVAHELFVGPIPNGQEVDHECRNRACANPDHLRLASHAQNSQNRGARAGSRSGVRGVTWEPRYGGRWIVRVGLDGRLHYGGSFADLAEAERAAIALRNELYTHNAEDCRAYGGDKGLTFPVKSAIEPREKVSETPCGSQE